VRTLRLKKNEDRRVRAGHLWIFSNELTALDEQIVPGDLVDIVSYGGTYIGRGYVNPHSLIAVRVLTRNHEPIDESFFANRIARAAALRQRLLPGEQTYRLVFGEADGLPGLVVDKYADVLVIQISTLGMHMRLGEILGALPTVGTPASTLVLRTDPVMAELEGFEGETRVLSGSVESPVQITQDDLLFEVDVLEGQKTGFYLDQRNNRRSARDLFAGLSVLDCFCYTGAWSLYAARGGARRVVGIDASERAVETARRNADLNNLGGICTFDVADVFERLEELEQKGQQFDGIVLDPPALVKSRRHLKQGEAAYERLNRLAMKLLAPNGLLITSSCSFHVSREDFQTILSSAARKCRREAIVIEWRGQARDHPTLLAMPETAYLKCAIVRVA
jgi:23S rRNA (cytosine1962-C5)-methyltransferase